MDILNLDTDSAEIVEPDYSGISELVTITIDNDTTVELDDFLSAALPKARKPNFFDATKDATIEMLDRAYPLYLHIRENEKLAADLIKHSRLASRERLPSKKKTALLAVMIAADPQSREDRNRCYDLAYVLKALAMQGVDAKRFVTEFISTNEFKCRKYVRDARRQERVAEQHVEGTLNVSRGLKSPRPYFALIYVDPDGTRERHREYVLDPSAGSNFGEPSDDEFEKALRSLIRRASAIDWKSSILLGCDDTVETEAVLGNSNHIAFTDE